MIVHALVDAGIAKADVAVLVNLDAAEAAKVDVMRYVPVAVEVRVLDVQVAEAVAAEDVEMLVLQAAQVVLDVQVVVDALDVLLVEDAQVGVEDAQADAQVVAVDVKDVVQDATLLVKMDVEQLVTLVVLLLV